MPKRDQELQGYWAQAWDNFRAQRFNYYCLLIFLVLFALSLLAELLANDKPLLLRFQGQWYFPVLFDYLETDFGGDFASAPDYLDPYVQDLLRAGDGWWLMPPVQFSGTSINFNLSQPAPSPPDAVNILGTDDQGRDVLARIVYGYRISVFFALALTLLSVGVGVLVGAAQGYFGGMVDLIGQRFIEIWSGMPSLFILIILASIIEPNFWWLLLITFLFSWMGLVDLVRAECLKVRNYEYVKAARVLGASDWQILLKHVLPNATVSIITFTPFLFASAITTLTALDFLGYGLPPGTPSLGELVAQAKNNLSAPWIGISVFLVTTGILALLLFIGSGLRDAFDPNTIRESQTPLPPHKK